ncbi:DUF6355 family natural product biosynthesis protein [Amycolatopsis sp. NPDC059657]|uniref:DUF6355 family natural product biosynthesis protein n=1 Tax=Amycolatopsis sp. NPDC059657 TaxID=3346899 RepID=UPI00366EEBFA
MKARTACRRVGVGFMAAVLAFAGSTVVNGNAEAAGRPAPESTAAVCGFYPIGMYRHCDAGTGMWVTVDAEDIWGGIHEVCVHPGINDLQPGIRWRIVGAWWNGGIHC